MLKADVNPKTGKRRVKVAGEETVVQPRLQVRCHCGCCSLGCSQLRSMLHGHRLMLINVTATLLCPGKAFAIRVLSAESSAGWTLHWAQSVIESPTGFFALIT